MLKLVKCLQSEVWFSDIDENPDDLVDEIVVNEDICNDLTCVSGEIMTFDQVSSSKMLKYHLVIHCFIISILRDRKQENVFFVSA